MHNRIPWNVAVPLFAVVSLVFTWGEDIGPVVGAVEALLLAGAVLAAVHHAEVVAHRVGEPLGSLLLAVAVTLIEVALIVTLMASGGDKAASLARDTVFAAVMISTNGIAGLSLLVGSRRFGVTHFNADGSGSALATVTTLATLSLVLPNFTTTHPGPRFSPGQLVFAAVASLALYLMFVLTQTTRHPDFFLPVAPAMAAEDDAAAGGAAEHRAAGDRTPADGAAGENHAGRPAATPALFSLGMLFVALVAVVGLAKVESPIIERMVAAAGFPHSFVGLVIATLVLLPETIAAVRAARRGRMQISFNLAYGSAIASIGLTIPTIALASAWIPGPLVLGLGPMQLVLLTLTVVVSMLTVVPGRATRLQGEVHLVVLAAFFFMAISP